MGIAALGTTRRRRQSVDDRAGLGELIRGISVALITTVDDTGIMRTRQLPNTNTGLDDNLWFLASRHAPLVQDLQERPDVLVTYADRGTGRFVVVNGAARVSNDPERVRSLWHPVLASWLPEGPDDPSLALIEVRVEWIDVWE